MISSSLLDAAAIMEDLGTGMVNLIEGRLRMSLDAGIFDCSRVAIEKAGGRMSVVNDSCRPIVLVEWSGDWLNVEFSSALVADWYDHFESTNRSLPLFRAVPLSQLEKIFKYGCDQENHDVLWMDKSLSKALEYGDSEKAVMVFDCDKIKPSFVQVQSDIAPDELEFLKELYPTAEVSKDGTKIWLSRLGEHDKRRTRPYEVEYGKWIPKDPHEALGGLMLLGPDLEILTEQDRSAMSERQSID